MKQILAVLLLLFIASCRVVRPGEVGIKQSLGKIKVVKDVPGPMYYNPFTSKVIKVNIRIVESFQKLELPTKEGLGVEAEISLLYHINPEKAAEVYKKFGNNYEEVMVLSNFRATAREISARYFAKELYATERQKVESAIAEELKNHIEPYGFIVDAVLLKDIILPSQIVQSIENKVQAEQEVLRMEFVVQKQKKEAERILIEAEAIKKANEIIAQSLNDKVLEYNRIKMYESLMNSNNSKIIISDSKTPIITNTETK